MTTVETLHVIETVGSGSGVVSPAEITSEAVKVRVTRDIPDTESGVTETQYFAGDTIDDYLGIGPPETQQASYDVVVVVAGLPAPDFIRRTRPEHVSVELIVEDAVQARASECPGCGRDLRETFKNGQCHACGFYFDQSHIPGDSE